MSGEEGNDSLFEAAKRLFDVFIQPSGDRFQCVLDQRCFSTKAIATAHLYKSHAENLRELMPEESAASGSNAGQESGVVEMEEGSQPQAFWSQEQADELVALQMALDEYNAQQQQTQPQPQQHHHESSRDQLQRRSSGSASSSNARQTPQLERTPSSATKRGRAGKQSMTKQERLLSLLSKTDDILQTVQRAVEQEQARQQVASSSSSASASSSSAGDSSFSASSFAQPQQPLLLTGGALYDFQLQGVSWLSSLHASGLNGILADEMGLGKTVQVIGFLAALAERFHIIGPHLITVPLGVLRTWREAFEKWCPAASVVVFHGTKEERYARFRDFARSLNEDEITSPCVVLTTYEMTLKDFATLQRTPRRWAYVVVDEAHRLKNWNSKLVQVLQALQPRRRLLLTGTPLQNNLSELWSLLNFLLPSIFDDVYNFLDWFNAPFDLEASASSSDVTLSDEERSVVLERLHAVLRPFLLRRVKADVLQSLPGKVERVVRCPPSPLQVALYKRIRDRVSLQQSISYMNVMMQLRKLCNHPFLVLDQEAISDELWARHLIKASGKLAVLSQLLNVLLAGRHKVLIFSQMVVMLDILEDFLAQAGIGHQRIDGQCSAADRSDRMQLFNDDEEFRFPVFLISTRAGGVGLNLQAADTVIIFDSDWNPQMDLQAQDRAHRLGQRNDVLVLRLVSTGPEPDVASVEEVLLSRAKHKLDTEALVLQSGQFAGKPNVSYSELFETKAAEAAAASGDGDNTGAAIAITNVDDCAAQIAAATRRPKDTPGNSEAMSPFSSLLNGDRELLVMTEEELHQHWDSHLQEAKETGSDDAPTGRRKRLVVNYNEDARWNELLQQQQQQQEERRLPSTAAGGAERPQSAEPSLADESLTTAEDESQAASRYSLEPAHSPTGIEEPPAVCAMCGQREVDEDDAFDESAPFKQAPDEDWGANPLNLPQEYDFDLVEHVSHEEQRVKVRRSVLLLCDGCNSAFHLECVGLAVVPPGDWFCEWCVHQMQRS